MRAAPDSDEALNRRFVKQAAGDLPWVAMRDEVLNLPRGDPRPFSGVGES